MSYATSYTTAMTQSFLQKIQIALVNNAIAISNESSGTANHAARVALASKVLLNPQGYAQLMAQGVAADGVTDGSSTDAAIDTRIAAIWNSYT